MKPTVTETQLIPIKPRNGLVAFASVVLNRQVYLGSIGVHSKLDGSGYRLTYPNKVVAGRSQDIYHPINQETASAIEQAIFAKYKEVIERSNDRYDKAASESGQSSSS